MEYLGHTNTAAYTIGSRYDDGGKARGSLGLGNMPATFKTYKQFPAPPITLERTATITSDWRNGEYENGTSNYDLSDSWKLQGDNRLGEFDSLRVPGEFSVTRNNPNMKFSTDDWRTSNSTNICAADRVLSGSELMRDDAVRLCREVDDKTQKMQDESTKRLEDRINDVKHWKQEIQDELEALRAENLDLEKMFGCVDKALEETNMPLDITLRCLQERKKRIGIDLVDDDVEKELLKELKSIRQVQEDLRHHTNDAKDQYELNCAIQRELEQDSAEKFSAIALDSKCHGLRNTSSGLIGFGGKPFQDNITSDEESWIRHTEDKIRRSQDLRTRSKAVRDSITLLLEKAAAGLTDQWHRTNAAFGDRIKEYLTAKQKLEAQLAKVLKEITDADKSLTLLNKSLLDKTAPSKVAETRLVIRKDRPNMEACYDKAHRSLYNEVSELQGSAGMLKSKIHEAQNALDQLQRTRAALESDLAIKDNSLYIDREKCMGMRQAYVMKPRLYTVATFN